MDWLDTVRIIDAVLAIANGAFLAARLMGAWSLMSGAQRLLFVHVGLACGVTVWSGYDALFNGAAGSGRHVLLFAAQIPLLIYLAEPTRKWRTRMGADPLGGKDFRNGLHAKGNPSA